MHGALDLVPNALYIGCSSIPSDPSTQEVDAKGSKVQGHLQKESKTGLDKKTHHNSGLVFLFDVLGVQALLSHQK